ncbi:hypothetical protein M896_030120 [Ordospora colligata OC4]|uniref:Uncharacterized protein n=1 Tax=Ordospora colligata OC4 TaxID=1354746 RepID=A0A0B2ULT3_9MICR|nr:uncharacterized protein M896_030120 [Ordospora colligata OC4]KHN70027.1 hypothetical protein M896_030120 [Ordospora colligata OC4]TBU16409.1 hypothetical protein CWI41_030080 [Ordospora colligata]TBU16594.1 hypothetical protein CWI40_030480 [Ordospora colligata]
MRRLVGKVLMYIWPLVVGSFLLTPVSQITGENPRENTRAVWSIVAVLCIPSLLAIFYYTQSIMIERKTGDTKFNHHKDNLILILMQLGGIISYTFTTYRCLHPESKVLSKDFLTIIKIIAVLSILKYMLFLSKHNCYAFVGVCRGFIIGCYLLLTIGIFSMVDGSSKVKILSDAIDTIESSQLTVKNIDQLLGHVGEFQKNQEQILQHIDTGKNIAPPVA